MKLINKFIYSNIFLSVAAVLLTVSAQIQLGKKPEFHPYLILIFFATLFEYNRHQLLLLLNLGISNSEKNQQNQGKLKKTGVILIAILLFLVAVIFVKPKVLLAFAFLGMLTFLYSMPGLSRGNFGFRLRDIPYLKNFIIAFVWSAATIFLPAIQAGENIFNIPVLLLFAERFFFIFAITIPFDIRDMQADRDAGIKTIPLLINPNKALVLSYFSLIICLLISFFHYRIQNNWFIIEALSISLATTYLFIKLDLFKSWSRYYYYILDGTLLLQGVLVLGFYFLNHI